MPDRSLRFVLSRRWALFALTVVAAAYASWWLGQWQFNRLTDRKVENAIVRTNEDRVAAPVADVLAPGRPVSERDEWRLVTATGTYDTDKTVVLRYRSRDEGSGIDVVVPLVTADGTALVVDRGWLEADPQGTDRSDIPDPPSGEVTVTGWVRENGTGSSTRVDDLSTRAIDSDLIGAATGLPVYTGFVELQSEDPSPTTSLTAVELPELDNGPHFFYGLQWWFFGVLAVFGFFYLMYDEWRDGPQGERLHRRARRNRPGGGVGRPDGTGPDDIDGPDVADNPLRPDRPAPAVRTPSRAEQRRELVRRVEERRQAEREQSRPRV